MTISSDIPNILSSGRVRLYPADTRLLQAHNRFVAKPEQKTQRDFYHTWFIRDWSKLAGFTQADAQRELGWSKAKASDVWNGQQYTQSIIDELAPKLKARPFELLLHPDEAMLLRRLRDGGPRAVTSNDKPRQVREKETATG